MHSGKILLKRANADYEAGFAVLFEDAPDRSFLHPRERAYLQRIAGHKRILSYLLGRKAAKAAIAQLLPVDDPADIAIDMGVFQFPVVQGTGGDHVQVSISHCNQLAVALAFPEEHPLAIDIESMHPDKTNLVSGLLSDGEKGMLSQCSLSQEAAYTMMWTVKEGLMKVLRTGLTIDFSLTEIQSLKPEANMYVSHFRYFGQYKALSVCCGGYACSIICPKQSAVDAKQFLDAFVAAATTPLCFQNPQDIS